MWRHQVSSNTHHHLNTLYLTSAYSSLPKASWVYAGVPSFSLSRSVSESGVFEREISCVAAGARASAALISAPIFQVVYRTASFKGDQPWKVSIKWRPQPICVVHSTGRVNSEHNKSIHATQSCKREKKSNLTQGLLHKVSDAQNGAAQWVLRPTIGPARRITASGRNRNRRKGCAPEPKTAAKTGEATEKKILRRCRRCHLLWLCLWQLPPLGWAGRSLIEFSIADTVAHAYPRRSFAGFSADFDLGST